MNPFLSTARKPLTFQEMSVFVFGIMKKVRSNHRVEGKSRDRVSLIVWIFGTLIQELSYSLKAIRLEY